MDTKHGDKQVGAKQKNSVGPVSLWIRERDPKDMKEWESFYYEKLAEMLKGKKIDLKPQEYIHDSGRKLYTKITEVIQAEMEEATELPGIFAIGRWVSV